MIRVLSACDQSINQTFLFAIVRPGECGEPGGGGRGHAGGGRPHHCPLPPSHLTSHPQPLRLQTGPFWHSFIASSSLHATTFISHPQPLRLQTGPSWHSFIAPSSLPATTFTSHLSPSTFLASDRSLLAFIHCSLIIARYHLHISPLTLNLFGLRQVPFGIHCSLYTAQCCGSEKDFFRIRILPSKLFRIRIVIQICLRIWSETRPGKKLQKYYRYST